ncbi:NPCL1 protein, partial [Nothoprocta pentlandii]|nr:NPCL1 protein [Nothoprocta pentlandii]
LLQVPVGLDQELALPKVGAREPAAGGGTGALHAAAAPIPQDSYLLEYFAALNEYLSVGVPTYFVTTGGYNFSSANGTNAICSSAGCDADSLT